MAKKVLNLDVAMPTEEREFVLGGVTYPINEMTVEDYIDATATSERMSAPGVTEAEKIKETARLIARQVPGLTAADLVKFGLDKLYAIAEFVRGEEPEAIIARLAAAQPKPDEAPAAEGAQGKA